MRCFTKGRLFCFVTNSTLRTPGPQKPFYAIEAESEVFLSLQIVSYFVLICLDSQFLINGSVPFTQLNTSL